jgi:hypothetical protein
MPNRNRSTALFAFLLVAGSIAILALAGAAAGPTGGAFRNFLPIVVAEPSDTPTPTEAPTQTPLPPITLVSLTSPVSPGDYATLVVETRPIAPSCFLSYVTPHGTLSQAAGLGTVAADGNGVCTWTWKIGTNTEPGTGHLSVTAGGANAGYDIVIQ